MKRPDGKEISKEFEAPWLTWKHSARHMRSLHELDQHYFASDPGEQFVEIDEAAGQKLYKFRYKTPIPESYSELAADAACTLRAALDQAGYACAIAAARSSGAQGKVRNAQFPFAENAESVASLRGARKSAQLPLDIFDVMANFRPYRDGNANLWALNQLANARKHAITVTNSGSATHAVVLMPSVGFSWRHGDLKQDLWPDLRSLLPKWNRERNELIWATSSLSENCELKNHQLRLFVSFDEPIELSDTPVLAALDGMGDNVAEVLFAVENKARDIGLF